MQHNNLPQILFTVDETSQILKTNKNLIYSLIKKGHLKALKLGSYKVRMQDIVEFLDKNLDMDLTDLDNIKQLEREA